MTELSEKEKRVSNLAIWIWRNLLASGIFIVCFGFLYLKCENIEDRLIETGTILKERIRIERGDYGWAASNAYPEDPDPTEQEMQEGESIRKHVNDFANKK